MNRYSIATELFEVPGGQQHLIYAPLLGVACQADHRLINTLCDIAEDQPPEERLTGLYDQLQALGFIAPQPIGPPLARRPPHPPLDEPFLPCETTLFLTSDCNLACRYCYGEGGRKQRVMPEHVARSAIDLLFANAAATGAATVRISFHGGGEPTLEFPLIREMVAHAEQRAAAADRLVEFGLTSNGMTGEVRMRWLIDHIDHINISFDGPQDIQDHQRPARGGGPSFPAVSRSLRQLDAAGKQYCLRGTITSHSEHRIPEIATHIVNHHKPHTLQIEPMFTVGRAITEDLDPPDPQRFIEGFLEAERICRDAGVILKFSGFRFPRINNAFCGIGRKNFAVTPQGLATSCFEVLEPADARSGTFFFGGWTEDGFVFDQKKIVALRALNETVPAFCRNCFAQFHCNGDCRGKGLFLGSMEDYRGGSRCRIIQGLIREKLQQTFMDLPGEGNGRRQRPQDQADH